MVTWADAEDWFDANGYKLTHGLSHVMVYAKSATPSHGIHAPLINIMIDNNPELGLHLAKEIIIFFASKNDVDK